MEHTTKQHANLNDSCLLQTTDSDEYGGTAPFSEAEARIVKLIAENSPLRSFVNLHSGEFALYAPWDSQQKLAVGQPVGLAAAAARQCSLWAGLWVWDPFWPLLLPGEAHCGSSCWPPLLLRLPSSWHIGYLLGSAHCCLLLPKPVYRYKTPARGLCGAGLAVEALLLASNTSACQGAPAFLTTIPDT